MPCRHPNQNHKAAVSDRWCRWLAWAGRKELVGGNGNCLDGDQDKHTVTGRFVGGLELI